MVDPVGNFEIAAALGIAGIAVFPAQTAGDDRKKPQPGVMWRGASTTDEAGIRRFWQRYPDAAPAMDLRKTPFLVIDCDAGGKVSGQRPGRDWLAEACERNDYPIERIPIVVTPSGGWHCYFRQRPGEKLGNSRGSLPPKAEVDMDVRGAGGYVIAPGAVIDIGDYHYLDDNCTIEDAPELPAWLAEILMGEGGRPPDMGIPISEHRQGVMPAGPTPADHQNSPQIMHDPMQERARAEAYADRALDDECAQVRSAPKGGRNIQLNQSALKLGHYVGGGHLAEGHVVAALTAAARDAGLNAVETAKTIRSGLEAGKRSPKDPPAREVDHGAAELARQVVAAYDGTLHDVETGEIVVHEAPATGELPSHLTVPPGLVGDIVEWIVATSRFPLPALALGAALTIVGTAAGRQFAGPTRSGTHLYVLGLGPTSVGKEHARQCIFRIMKAAGLGHHLGPDDFSSATALIKHVLNRPLSVCPMDEFGAFLGKINARKASTHEKGMSSFLRKAWGASFAMLPTPAYAQVQSEEIEAPSLSIYGTSTPEEFFTSLQAADVDNGVLNRFMVIATTQKPAERDPEADPGEVPPAIAAGLRAIAFHAGEFWAASANAARVSRVEHTLLWGEGAREMYADLGAHVRGIVEASAAAASHYGRTVEMALRVATIVAIGRSPDAVLTAADMAYGAELALWSAEMVRRASEDHMAASDAQALAKRIIRALRASGGKMRKRDLWRRLDHAARWQDVDGALKSLAESGQVERLALKQDGPGRPTEIYALTS